MVRTQIQLPDPLYREVKRIARQQDWSIAEVVRRGVEAMARCYPEEKRDTDRWTMPARAGGGLKIADPERLRDLLSGDQELR